MKYIIKNSLIVKFTVIFIVFISIFYVVRVFSQPENIKFDNDEIRRNTETQIFSDSIWFELVNLDRLTRESKLIVIGTPVQNKCVRIRGSKVVTQYVFRIDEVIKGNIQTGIGVEINFPGGLVQDLNNRMLHVITPGFKKMKNNSTYLLFLKQNNQGIEPNRGPRGVFELSNDSIISHGILADKKTKKGEELLNKIDFLANVRKLGKDSSINKKQ